MRRPLGARSGPPNQNTRTVHSQGAKLWPKELATHAEKAVQATSFGMNWMREIAEQNLDQSKAAMDGFLMIARKALDGVDQQASVICKTSMLFAEQTLSNTFDFAHKLLRMKEPQELVKLQSDFVSRQAQLAGDQTKGVAELNDVTRTTLDGAAEHARRQFEAA